MEFVIFEDNSGDYYWTIVAGDGETLARSGSMGSHEQAEKATQRLRLGAGSALSDRATAARPVDLGRRSDARETTPTPSVRCPPCRLRFTPAASAHLVACPACGERPVARDLEATTGFRIFRPEDVPRDLPEAVALSLPVPDPNGV